MRDWEGRVSGDGAQVIDGEGAAVRDYPDEDAAEACKALGKSLATMVYR